MMLTRRTSERFANIVGRNHKARPWMARQMHFQASALTRVTMRKVQAARKIRLQTFTPMSSHRTFTLFSRGRRFVWTILAFCYRPAAHVRRPKHAAQPSFLRRWIDATAESVRAASLAL